MFIDTAAVNKPTGFMFSFFFLLSLKLIFLFFFIYFSETNFSLFTNNVIKFSSVQQSSAVIQFY